MAYYVYILLSKNNNTSKCVTYVGYTSNLKERIKLHNTSKGAKFTKGRQWILVYKRFFNKKELAMKYEYKLKHDKKKRSLIKKKFIN